MLSLRSRNPSLLKTYNISCRSHFRTLFKRYCRESEQKKDPVDSGPSCTVQLENVYKLYNLEKGPPTTYCLNRNMALKLFTEMQTIRRLENACANLYKEKEIRGFCHLYVGQEAICVGMKASFGPNDSVITSYRAHGWTWLMGQTAHSLIAELCQKETGCSRGKGGSMHTYAPNFYGGNGIVGAQIPLGAGVALAHAYLCQKAVNFAIYGDGAANQGQLYESFNIACLWKLPVVFVCENNKYGMGTSVQRSSCSTDYYTRGDFIPGLWVNGNNILAVINATEYCIQHALSCGPMVLEFETYRYHGHSMSDPGTSYRTREEVQNQRDKFDPITMFKTLCVNNNLVTNEEFKKIDDNIKKEMDETVKKVRTEKEPDLSELTTDIYANNCESKIRNIVNYDLKHANVGQPFVSRGPIKPTPKEDIKEIPKEKANIDKCRNEAATTKFLYL